MQALRKASGALSVSVECRDALDVPVLSAALRKSGAQALWASNLDVLSQLAEEQSEAEFDFPGPCPVIFNGDSAQAEAAVAAGASAVVLAPSERSLAASMGAADVIWRVNGEEELRQLSEADVDTTLLLSQPSDELLAALPADVVAVAAVQAMAAANAEVEEARRLRAAGACAVLLLGACVGDGEDLPYCQAREAHAWLHHGLQTRDHPQPTAFCHRARLQQPTQVSSPRLRLPRPRAVASPLA